MERLGREQQSTRPDRIDCGAVASEDPPLPARRRHRRHGIALKTECLRSALAHTPNTPRTQIQPVELCIALNHRLLPTRQAVWCLTGHASGQLKLSTSRIDRGKCHARFDIHEGPVTGIALDAEERVAISVSADASLGLTDLESGSSLKHR
jgi:hypothetical protein